MDRSIIAALATTLLGLPVAGCAAGDRGDWQGTVADSAGIEIVTNTGDGLWGPAEGWTVQQELAIGSAEGDPRYQFGQIVGMDVGSDGRVYILDGQAKEIRVFAPDGTFLLAMGRSGSGPGELSQGAGPVIVGAGDTVQVPDAMQQRVTRYTADGEPAGSYPLSMDGAIARRWLEAPNGDLVQEAMIMQGPGQSEVDQKALLLRRDATGEVVDTLLEMPLGEAVRGGRGGPAVKLFGSAPMFDMGPDGRLYFGMNSEYRIEQYSSEGTLERIVRKDVQRRPVTASDREPYRRGLVAYLSDRGLPPHVIEGMGQSMTFADFYPAFAHVMGGPDGTLWVEGVQGPQDLEEEGGTFDLRDTGNSRWEVFDDRGRLLGTVEMPPLFSPLLWTADGDGLWGILRDELDVQYAMLMRLDRGTTP